MKSKWKYDPETKTVTDRDGNAIAFVNDDRYGYKIAAIPVLLNALDQMCNIFETWCKAQDLPLSGQILRTLHHAVAQAKNREAA